MDLIITIVVLMYSAILHEVSHGVMAGFLGDPTAKQEGRITLNPIKHIDPIMTIAFPILLYFSQMGLTHKVLFGGAKGVPYDSRNFKDPKTDSALVAAAGPMTNLALAVIAALLLKTPLAASELGANILSTTLFLNLTLTVFNMVPIPPLDGSKVLAAFLPDEISSRFLAINSYGYLAIFLFLYFHLLDPLLYNAVDLFLRLFRLT